MVSMVRRIFHGGRIWETSQVQNSNMCCTRVFSWVEADLQRQEFPGFATYTNHRCLAYCALTLNSAGFILWPSSCPQCIGASGIFTDCMPLITNQLVPMQRQASRCHNVI